MTKDLELWVRPTRNNGERIIRALQDFGTNSPIPAEAFERPETMLVLGRAPFRVDLLTDLPGVTFDDAWARRVTVRLDGHDLPLICRADLIQNKRTVGRPQDIADALELEKLDAL